MSGPCTICRFAGPRLRPLPERGDVPRAVAPIMMRERFPKGCAARIHKIPQIRDLLYGYRPRTRWYSLSLRRRNPATFLTVPRCPASMHSKASLSHSNVVIVSPTANLSAKERPLRAETPPHNPQSPQPWGDRITQEDEEKTRAR